VTDTEVIDRAAGDARDARGHRLVWAFVGVAVVGLVLLAVAFFSYRMAATGRDAKQDATIAALGDQADDNARDAQRLAEQVEQLGAEPVVEPPTVGERGERGEQGDRGPRGETGPAGPTGAAGSTGAQGPAGVDGQPGADGAQGPIGPPGPEGPAGEPGPTCPAGYTAQSRRYDPTPVPGDEETWWVCVADLPVGEES
jgi:cbb3-type cytochrome oxidase subunit 3